jgi:hypothetical protein
LYCIVRHNTPPIFRTDGFEPVLGLVPRLLGFWAAPLRARRGGEGGGGRVPPESLRAPPFAHKLSFLSHTTVETEESRRERAKRLKREKGRQPKFVHAHARTQIMLGCRHFWKMQENSRSMQGLVFSVEGLYYSAGFRRFDGYCY